MSVPALQVLLGGAALGGLVAGMTLLRPSLPDKLPPVRTPAQSARDRVEAGRPPLDSLTRVAAPRAPFRASRTPPSVAYDPDRSQVPGVQGLPSAPRPVLVVTGIVWGRGSRGSAVLEGLPGAPGPRVVRAGEEVGGLKVRRIQRDLVVVTGLDTTWTLTVRAPWK